MAGAPHSFEGAPTLIEGAPGTGKTEALMRRAAALLNEGVPASSVALFAATPTSADVVRQRLASVVESSDDLPLVTTLRDFELTLLATSEAQQRFGRRPVVLLDFEESFLLEDVKLTGVAPRRLAEMLKFFYRSWADLEPMEGDWFYSDEEQRVYDCLVAGLQSRRAYVADEIARRAWEWLRDGGAAVGPRFDHVLVDDFPLLSRASQEVARLSARESLTVAGDPLVGERALEAYPCREGLELLARAHSQAQVVHLEESRKSPAVARALEHVAADMEGNGAGGSFEAQEGEDGTVAVLTCPRAEEEFEAVAAQVERLLEQGRRPEDLAVAGVTPAWASGVRRALEERGIPCAGVVPLKIGGDFRTSERCHGAQAVTLLKLAADPEDPVALRSWCGFGDYLANSSLMVALMEAGGCPTMGSDSFVIPDQDQARLAQEAERVAAALERGRVAMASLTGLQGRDLVEAAWRAVDGTADEALPTSLVQALDMAGDAADATDLLAALEQRFLFPVIQGTGVLVGAPNDFLGLSRPVMIVAGLGNGLVPSRSYFDPARVERDRRPGLLRRDQQRIYGALAAAEHELYLSTFSAASLVTAEKLQLKIDRVRLRNGERLCDVSPSETVRALTGVSYHD